jgi:pantoate--beta-alanine ligase
MRILEDKAQVAETIQRLQRDGAKLGLVSTMGVIHEGHRLLLRRAREMSDIVLVLVYANPMLVEDAGMLARFEANRANDQVVLEKETVDYVFFARREDLAPPDQRTFVRPERLIERLQGVETERYIIGLATAYFQALNLFRPNFAFVSQKNYLDFHVLKRLIKDFHLRTEAVLCPTVRDESGLPYSSFHQFFSPEEKAAALQVYQALGWARETLREGETSGPRILQGLLKALADSPNLQVLHVGLLDPATLEPLEKVQQEALISITARFHQFRITDNIIFRRTAE